jgi:hypothetical protein
MPQGLQVFDAAGNILLDTSTIVMKRMISYPVTVTSTSPNTIALTIPSTNTVLGAIAVPVSAGAASEVIGIELSGSDLIWTARVNNGLNYSLDVLIA